MQVLQDEEGRPGKELVPHCVFLSEMKELNRILSQVSGFPSGRMPDGHLSVTFGDLGQRCDPVEEGCVFRLRLQIQNAWSNQDYRQARRQAAV